MTLGSSVKSTHRDSHHHLLNNPIIFHFLFHRKQKIAHAVRMRITVSTDFFYAGDLKYTVMIREQKIEFTLLQPRKLHFVCI